MEEQQAYFYSSNKALLDSYIEYANQKYQSKEIVLQALTIYISTGDPTAITRDNNFRYMFLKPEEVQNVLSESGLGLKEYIDDVLTRDLAEEAPTR